MNRTHTGIRFHFSLSLSSLCSEEYRSKEVKKQSPQWEHVMYARLVFGVYDVIPGVSTTRLSWQKIQIYRFRRWIRLYDILKRRYHPQRTIPLKFTLLSQALKKFWIRIHTISDPLNLNFRGIAVICKYFALDESTISVNSPTWYLHSFRKYISKKEFFEKFTFSEVRGQF